MKTPLFKLSLLVLILSFGIMLKAQSPAVVVPQPEIKKEVKAPAKHHAHKKVDKKK